MTPQVGKETRLLFGLDPFGDDPEIEPLGHHHDRFNDGEGIEIVAKIGDETAVDLERVERQVANFALCVTSP